MKETSEASESQRQPGTALQLSMNIGGGSWWDLVRTVGPILVLAAGAILLGLHFVSPSPPHQLTISSGPKGSTFETTAERYKKILARSGITLNIVESAGSVDNLNRLIDPHSSVDIALVQSGVAASAGASDLVSLGSMFYEPLMIFYRSAHPLLRLSELHGQRIAIGPEGSGTRVLALALLKANEIEAQGPTQLLTLEGDAATSALLNHQVDAVFLTGDSASSAAIRAMMHADGVRLFEFAQAEAYARRFPYLNKLVIPAGAFDLGENLPSSDVNMLAPTVELLTHSNLHPALSDLLIEAAFEVHGHPSVFQAAGQFPSSVTPSYPISNEAARYYKSGSRSFTYRYLPIWLASLVNRIVVVLVPIFVVVIPGLKYLPQLYNWRLNRRIHRRYGELMALERRTLGKLSAEQRAALLQRLEQIENSVISGKMPGSHAEQFYLLRQHIGFVRENLARPSAAAT